MWGWGRVELSETQSVTVIYILAWLNVCSFQFIPKQMEKERGKIIICMSRILIAKETQNFSINIIIK